MNDTISNWRRAKLNAIAARFYPPLSHPWLASDVPRTNTQRMMEWEARKRARGL